MPEEMRSTQLIEESIRSIVQTSSEIARTVAELPEEALRWKPAAHVWSIAEILGHVQEAMPYWAGEMERVAANPGAEWGRNHQDESRLAAVAGAAQRSRCDGIEGVGKAADAVVTVLRTLHDEDLRIESPSRNPGFGVKPLSFVLDHLIVSHLRGHLNQIKRNRNQFIAQVTDLTK